MRRQIGDSSVIPVLTPGHEYDDVRTLKKKDEVIYEKMPKFDVKQTKNIML